MVSRVIDTSSILEKTVLPPESLDLRRSGNSTKIELPGCVLDAADSVARAAEFVLAPLSNDCSLHLTRIGSFGHRVIVHHDPKGRSAVSSGLGLFHKVTEASDYVHFTGRKSSSTELSEREELGAGSSNPAFLYTESSFVVAETRDPSLAEKLYFPLFRDLYSTDPSLIATLHSILHQPGLIITRADRGDTAYFVKTGNGDPLVVVKPTILEPESSFHGYGMIVKEGIGSAEAPGGELLAYEYSRLFGGRFPVPPTVLGELTSPTIEGFSSDYSVSAASTNYVKASFQLFVPHCRNLSELSGRDKAELNIEQLQNAAIFDICLVNTDRHAANILVDRSGNIYLIDNGLILPRKLESEGSFTWMEFPQIKRPIGPEMIHFIHSLDPSMLIGVLEVLKLRSIADFTEPEFQYRLASHIVAVELLKSGSKKGMTLYEIARFLTNANSGDFYSYCQESIAESIYDIWQMGDDKSIDALRAYINKALESYIQKKSELSIAFADFSSEHEQFESICTQALNDTRVRFLSS